jgi:hypothetical protein
MNSHIGGGMEPEKTCKSNYTSEERKLNLAVELSQKEWKLGVQYWSRAVPAVASISCGED